MNQRLLLLLAFLPGLTGPLALRAAPPNIIVVMADDQGIGDLGAHGNDSLRTPHLDRFAMQGVQLTRFYVEPVCAPTRAALMTGRYYYRSGVIHTSRGGAKMHGSETTIAELLRRAGYRTGIFGKWHLGDNFPMRPEDQGFEETLVHKSGGIGQPPDLPNSYFNPWLWHNSRRIQARGYCTDVFFDAALDWIAKVRGDRFFVYLPLNAPHTPLEIADRYTGNYKAMGLDDTTARVYGMIENLDDNFGHLLEKLDELELRQNTLVVFLTDNGAQQARFNAGFRGRKSQTYEGGIRVPFLAQWPATLRGGRSVDRLAAHIDLAPTLAELAGVPPDRLPEFDGQSLLPLLHGATANWPDRTLYFQCHRGLEPRRWQNCAAVSQRFKLVGHPGTFNEEKFQPGNPPALELYDLVNDPAEKLNLAGEQPDRVRELRAGYEAWFADVRAARSFTPGVIHVGNAAENPLTLCRYQDATFAEGRPAGWSLVVERAGRYRVAINRGAATAGGRLVVRWQGETLARPLLPGGSIGVFQLKAGTGTMEIWSEDDGQGRVALTDNSNLGDATLERLE